MFNAPAPSASSHSNFRRCEQCEGQQVFHITNVSRDGDLTELHLCEECAQPALTRPYPRAVAPASRSDEVGIEIERVIISEIHHEQVIVFREVAGERRMPFVIGIFEATSIDRAIKGCSSPRPLTYDSWWSTITAFGAVIHSVWIHDFVEHTYFAELRLEVGGSQLHIDVRPSDAVALAIKAGSPVYTSDRLLAEESDVDVKSA